MYPNNEVESTTWDLGYLDTILDGLHRPGHFNGVCTIVDRLLRAVQPTRMYMGEKDFQQCLVIRRMLEITNSRVELITCPTLRELSGLAMSSRNERLSKSARERASAIYYCLKNIRTDMSKSTFPELQHRFIEYLRSNGFETEYLLLADANTLEIMENFDGSRQMVVLIACKFEGVRLIDNLRLS
jgi:pantoate--beta-alanine ligase